MSYAQFLEAKSQINTRDGFDPVFMPSMAKDFQKAMIEWSVMQGRGALFEDCGLGKTLQELAFAQNVVQKTNGNVLILTPIAVGGQMIREAEKFGIEAARSFNGKPAAKITITNYEKLHLFDPNDFVGCVCDESSILKNFNGKRKTEITEFMKKMRYRLLATATAAPNDFVELGTSSEALGYLGYMDMLNKFFKNDLNNSAQGRMRGEVIKWRLKGHAELPFWRWVCSWARAIRKPSDLGFSDDGYILPPINERVHIVESRTLALGMLFALPAVGLDELREERRRTVTERCERAAELVQHDRPATIWCHLNEEGDALEKMLTDFVQVSGKDSDEAKEEKLLAFADGKVRGLITKPKIGAWGLNFQHCAHSVTFPTHSYEQHYQQLRRFYRFGQKNEVVSDIVATEGEQDVLKNLHRKAQQAEKMFSNIVAEMNNAMMLERLKSHTTKQELPAWL